MQVTDGCSIMEGMELKQGPTVFFFFKDRKNTGLRVVNAMRGVMTQAGRQVGSGGDGK